MTADKSGDLAWTRADRIIGVTPFGLAEARLAVAVARAGGLGTLDLGRDRDAALTALELVERWWGGPFAIRIGGACPVRPEEVPKTVHTVLVDLPALQEAQPYLPGRRLLVEVVDPGEARAAARLGADGLIARGCEAGGRVGELTTFVLLQHLLGDAELDRPVWAAGGIGPHTAAAAIAGGAAGVVLDAQLALVRELDLPAEVARAIETMDGGETRLVAGHRIYAHPDLPVPDGTAPSDLAARLGVGDLREQLLPVGQDGALARPLAERYKTAGGVVQAVAAHIDEHLAAAVRAEPLAAAAAADGAAYPVLQGPMTRVSDRPEFAAAVAAAGGVPFVALALMTGEEAGRLLAETARRLGGRPWGAGVLGFAPREIRAAQLEAIRLARPPYALIAGGRPAQAAPLEEAGIATYLHVPSPALLERFLAEGARRFVFEGMECGGHIGPRAAFPLWEAQVDVLLAFLAEHPQEAARTSVAFAGGVHDARSAAMVAALAGPLAERGVQIRVLMGTAYLFTEEAVATGAIVPGFQQVAVECERTVLLETAPGNAVRCAHTPYADAFQRARRDLAASGVPRQEVWAKLERHNLGRLRLASRGLRREGEELRQIEGTEQYREGMFMMGQAAVLRSAVTTIADLHEQVSAGAGAFLAERARRLRSAPEEEPAPRPLDIAIVGIGCAFPGARDAEEYWANVLCGADAVTEVPGGRRDGGEAEDTPAAQGGFLPAIPFDAEARGIPPGSLGDIAPAHLLALEVAARALDDAGYADRPFDRSRAAVIFAAGMGDAPSPQAADGASPATITGWIAERLDLGGAECTIADASPAALDAACKELVCGGADLVLCGGVELRDEAPGGPPSGRCAPFDAGDDGVAPGEGAACVALKRLADAERDGDRIYAVIKAVAAAGDGRSASRAEGRRRALQRAHRDAGIPPSRIGLVEARGTGAAAGDRAELTALTRAFTGTRPGGVTLGSVASQIGHTGRAAGLAGLIKTARALHAGVRPGTLHLNEPTAAWDPETSPFVFSHTPRPWPAEPGERCAGLSASGLGGTAFHAVLAGYGGAPEPVSGTAAWPAELFLFRGADRAEARERMDRIAALGTGARLRDLARTAAEQHSGPVQVALVATSPEDLAAKLEPARRFEAAPGVYPAVGERPGRVAFLFPGHGGLRPGMLADLFVAFPRLQRLLRLSGGRYAEAMFPPAAFTAEEEARQRQALGDIRIAQPALAIAGIAVHRLLTELGVRPDMAAGHGCGELTALCAAGVFGETDLLELAAARAEAILRAVESGESGDPGAMAVVTGTPQEVQAVLETVPRVVLAAHEAPRQVVISGPAAAVCDAMRALNACGLAAEPIPGACALHSPLAAGAATGLSVELAGRRLSPPAFPVWSNLTAAPYRHSPELLAATLAEQVAAPVRFAEQIEAMYEAGARVFVETGPGRSLTRLVGRILEGLPHTVVTCDRPAGRGLPGLHALLTALAELAALGVEVDPLPLFTGRDAVVLSAPPARPAWTIGRPARPADAPRPSGTHPAAAPDRADRDAAVLEYLRTGRELLAAQRDVLLGYLGISLPQPREDRAPAASAAPHVPAPRPVPGQEAPAPGGETSAPEEDVHFSRGAVASPGEDTPASEDDAPALKEAALLSAGGVSAAEDVVSAPDEVAAVSAETPSAPGVADDVSAFEPALEDAPPGGEDGTAAPESDASVSADAASASSGQAPPAGEDLTVSGGEAPAPQGVSGGGTSALEDVFLPRDAVSAAEETAGGVAVLETTPPGPAGEAAALSEDQPAAGGGVSVFEGVFLPPEAVSAVEEETAVPAGGASAVEETASGTGGEAAVPDDGLPAGDGEAPALEEDMRASRETESAPAGDVPAWRDGTPAPEDGASGPGGEASAPGDGRPASGDQRTAVAEDVFHVREAAPETGENASVGEDGPFDLKEEKPDSDGGTAAPGNGLSETSALSEEVFFSPVAAAIPGGDATSAESTVPLPSGGLPVSDGEAPALAEEPSPHKAVFVFDGNVSVSEDGVSALESAVPGPAGETTAPDGDVPASHGGTSSPGEEASGEDASVSGALPPPGDDASEDGTSVSQDAEVAADDPLAFAEGTPKPGGDAPGSADVPGDEASASTAEASGGGASAPRSGLLARGPVARTATLAGDAETPPDDGDGAWWTLDADATRAFPVVPPVAPMPVPPSRHVVRPVELPAAGPVPVPGPLSGRRCLIVNDGLGVAPELVTLLESHGVHAGIAADADEPADAVIHLAALRPGGPPVLPRSYEKIRNALHGGTSRLLLVTGTGGMFGRDGRPDVVTGAGLRGLARTLALEHPAALVRAVDVNTACGPRALAEQLVVELMSEPGAPVVVGHDGWTRRTLELVPQELTGEAPLPLDRDGVVLLTGEARGVTARLARALAGAAGCHIEIIGRTPPDEDDEPDPATAPAGRRLRAVLARLEGSAASVRYQALDLGDPQAVRAAVADVYARYGRLDGVIHGTGTPQQHRPPREAGSFARLWQTTAGAAATLAEAVREDLGFFVVLGSASGMLGEEGQAAHAAAGDACQTLAPLWGTRLRGRVLAACWGPWACDDPASGEAARDQARRRGAPLDPDAAVGALLREIAVGADSQVVFTGAAP